MANSNLQAAKAAKNDEFYTRIEDINAELNHYEDKFKDKVVFCNCDDPTWSNFWKYFHMNFEYLGLKKLIATHYEPDRLHSYKIEYAGGNDLDFSVGTVTSLRQNGDFRSPECIGLLKDADIVVSNPPFSLARKYLATLMEHSKKFIIVGDLNWITYKEVFPWLKDNRMWIGYNHVKQFIQPDGTIKKFGNKLWYTNFDIPKRHESIDTPYRYAKKDQLYPNLYPKYDNFDAINVNKVSEIPMDYTFPMGVPVTFLENYNPDQFKIIGNLGSYAPDGYSFSGAIYVNGKKIFKRILIQKEVEHV